MIDSGSARFGVLKLLAIEDISFSSEFNYALCVLNVSMALRRAAVWSGKDKRPQK